MAAAYVRTPEGQIGVIVVLDNSDDGSIVILECEEAEGESIVIPSKGDDDYGDDDYEYDLRVAAEALQSPEPFRVVLDVTAMEERSLPFELGRFIARAAQAAHEPQPIVLDEANAGTFGYKAFAR